ncbi:MAG TPA: hypothetical protein VJK04_03220 [Candidatus Paceibacterota bacterium]
MKHKLSIFFFVLLLPLATFFYPQTSVHGAGFATLSLGPGSGTFVVGSTFTVSVFLDTGGESANALDVYIAFPPDKLQVVSPSTGKSIIGVWTSQPSFDNQNGAIHYQGGIPTPGINTTNGLISTITFRAKVPGRAVIRFERDGNSGSRVFLNDGRGTEFLGNTNSAIYDLVLPPPAGPIVSSPTHPDESKWYNLSTALLNFVSNEPVGGYSYTLDNEPVSVTDDISEGAKEAVSYQNLKSGTHYFHIKSLREGKWGGITHFAINVDADPPADFKINITPKNRTVRQNPVIAFETTDANSGIDHYEIKIISLTNQSKSQKEAQPFFVEATSPYVPTLPLGRYDVIVHAYDNAGNYREIKTNLEIVTTLFEFTGKDGVYFKGNLLISWVWIIFFGLILLVLFSYILWKVRGWYHHHRQRFEEGAINDPVIKARLKELDQKKSEYGKVALFLLALSVSFLLSSNTLRAEGTQVVSPPVVSLVSQNISNDELFYIGGRVEVVDSTIVIYLQNIQTGETFSMETRPDKTGAWFYSHNAFLTPGRYLLWTQSKLNEQQSPPSPQVQMTVTETALQFGSTRLSYETIFIIIALILVLVSAGLIIFIVFYIHRGQKIRRMLRKELLEAEDTVRRGFVVIRRDIEAELMVIQKLKLRGVFYEEEKAREEKLLRDLELVKLQIGKELLDIEHEL